MFFIYFQEASLQCITMSQDNLCISPRKKLLNNSKSDLISVDNKPTKVLNVHNMLNANKENAHYNTMEKNLARSLRPALRTVNQQMETPKVFKQIRFNLGSGQNDSLTPTPPPKEFKRFGARKTLRNERCISGKYFVCQSGPRMGITYLLFYYFYFKVSFGYYK